MIQAGYDAMNRMTSRSSGGPLYFAGTLTEAASVTIGGKPADVTADNKFSATAAVSSGTSSVLITARDYSGNLRTNTYQVSQSGSSSNNSYDNNGNLISDGTRTFEWDAENRLLAIESGTHRSEFTYDGRDRRVRIVEKVNGSTTTDHWYLWCELEICEERDSTGGTVTKRFFPQGEQQGTDHYFYTNDHLGTVREMTDSLQALRARYDYDPYGRMTKLAGDKDAAFGFARYYLHTASELLLTPYRIYVPDLSRWASEDPLGFAAGNNFYAYVDNDPVNHIDPLGLQLQSPAPQPTPPPRPVQAPPRTPAPKPSVGAGLLGVGAIVGAGLLILLSPKPLNEGDTVTPIPMPPSGNPYPKESPYCPDGAKGKWTCLAAGHATPNGHNMNQVIVYALGYGGTEAAARKAALDNVQGINVRDLVFGGRAGYVRHPHIINCWRGKP